MTFTDLHTLKNTTQAIGWASLAIRTQARVLVSKSHELKETCRTLREWTWARVRSRATSK